MDLEVFYISAIPFYRNFRPLFPLREPDSENHSGRTHKSHRRDVFTKYQKRRNKSCYSIEIYIVGRTHHSQMAHHGIPQSEAKHRRHKSEKQDIEKHRRDQQLFETETHWVEKRHPHSLESSP